MESFNSIFALLSLQYGVEIDDDDAIDIGLVAWNKIGNKNYRLYRFRAEADPESGAIDLPCNCDVDMIESVTYDFEDWNYTDNLKVNGDYQSAFTEHYIEANKHFKDEFYQSGKYVKYEKGFNRIFIHPPYLPVNILYKGVVMDEEQLPYLTHKETEAIACYIAYTYKFKEGWQTNNHALLQMAQLLEQRWLKLCDAARVRKLNQNDMNEILDVRSSYGRKYYGKSYKPIR